MSVGSDLFIFRTETTPQFMYAAPTADQDSTNAIHNKILEPGISKIISNFSSECCRNGGHFIDVGGKLPYITFCSLARANFPIIQEILDGTQCMPRP